MLFAAKRVKVYLHALLPQVERVENLTADPLGELRVDETELNRTLEEALDEGPLRTAIRDNVGDVRAAVRFLATFFIPG